MSARPVIRREPMTPNIAAAFLAAATIALTPPTFHQEK